MGKTACRDVRDRKDERVQAAKKGGEVSRTGVARKGVRRGLRAQERE